METIFEILRRKEAQLAALQEEVDKLRAAAEIVAREQGIAFEGVIPDKIESQLSAAASAVRPSSASPATAVLRKSLP